MEGAGPEIVAASQQSVEDRHLRAQVLQYIEIRSRWRKADLILIPIQFLNFLADEIEYDGDVGAAGNHKHSHHRQIERSSLAANYHEGDGLVWNGKTLCRLRGLGFSTLHLAPCVE